MVGSRVVEHSGGHGRTAGASGSCKWDHKPFIRKNFDLDPYGFMVIPGTGLKVYLDIWSNIHYGHVGAEAGFRPEVVQGPNLVPSNPYTGQSDHGDYVATAIGINLHGSVPAGRMTTALLHQAIMDKHGLTSRQR
ncbi:polymorphic toxin type 44 domain-containing protein [Dactylosporangium sp. NPDC005555]|uniref:polymorphic toxin type 44 domain-containing protein n=1 Tax=Dactylosporangium sp. NPDC005555 TaxID=3154889 RepID=UPI0033BE11A1